MYCTISNLRCQLFHTNRHLTNGDLIVIIGNYGGLIYGRSDKYAAT